MIDRHLFAGTVRLWQTSVIWWPLGLFIYLAIANWLSASVRRELPMEEILKAFPPLLAEIFVGEGAAAAFLTEYGRTLMLVEPNFFGTGPIYAAVYALFLAPALAMREWDRGTLDTLLARPLSRRTYLLTRFLAFAFVTATVSLGVAIAHAIAIGPVSSAAIRWGGLIATTLAWCLVALAFGGVAFLVAVARLSPGAGMTGTLAAMLGMFVLNLAGVARSELEPLANLSFFKWWKPIDLLLEQRVDLGPFLLYGGVALVALVAATLLFERRDLA